MVNPGQSVPQLDVSPTDGERLPPADLLSMDSAREQTALKLSTALTLVIGLVGIYSGLVTGSHAIVFDGIYSFVDVIVTLTSLAVSRLLAREGSRRFQYGYFHLEPLLALVGGSVLAIACIYAAINSFFSIMSGGHIVSFGRAGLWAATLSLCGFSMSVYIGGQARALDSMLLKLEARSWMVTTALSVALLVSFVLAALLQRTALHSWVRYIDPLVLLGIAVSILPAPLSTVSHAMREVLQLAPDKLDQQVHVVMDEVAVRHGFIEYSSHAAKIGQTQFVEIHVLVKPNSAVHISTADTIRGLVASRLNAVGPQLWLTLDVTADRAWM